jgi:hypothetical protein
VLKTGAMALRRGFSFPCALRPPSSICFCLLSESSFQRILLLALEDALEAVRGGGSRAILSREFGRDAARWRGLLFLAEGCTTGTSLHSRST